MGSDSPAHFGRHEDTQCYHQVLLCNRSLSSSPSFEQPISRIPQCKQPNPQFYIHKQLEPTPKVSETRTPENITHPDHSLDPRMFTSSSAEPLIDNLRQPSLPPPPTTINSHSTPHQYRNHPRPSTYLQLHPQHHYLLLQTAKKNPKQLSPFLPSA